MPVTIGGVCTTEKKQVPGDGFVSPGGQISWGPLCHSASVAAGEATTILCQVVLLFLPFFRLPRVPLAIAHGLQWEGLAPISFWGISLFLLIIRASEAHVAGLHL